MKIASLFCFILISFGSVFAQEIDERLLSNYSQEELELMIKTDPEHVQMLNYALDNSMYVANYSASKKGELKTISVNSASLPSFLELNIEITDQNQYFKIEGEEKLLVVKSAIVLKHEMKRK